MPYIFGKVYFPRLVIPVAITISSLISFGIRLILLVGFMIYFMVTGASVHPNWMILLLPILLLIMGGLGLGSGIIISSLTIKYRDLQQFVSFGVQLLMFATPVIYPLSTAKGLLRWVVLLNPLTPLVETFRLAFLGAGTFNLFYLLYSLIFTLVVFLGVCCSLIMLKQPLWIRFDMSRTVISVENLSKSYRLGVIGTGSFDMDVKRWWASVRGTPDPYLKIGEREKTHLN